MSASVIETVTDPVQAAIAAAVKAATESVASQANAVALPTAANTNVPAAVMPRAAPLKMEDMQGGLSVDSWIKLKEFGFILGKSQTLFPGDIMVTIDLNAILPCFAIKFGNPAQYFKTYDRVTDSRGGSWAAAVERVQRADPRAREYRAVDVPMTVVTEVSDAKAGVLLEAGSTLGYSTPTTGWAEWEKFWRSLNGQTTGVVNVKLGWIKKSNAAGNTWGLVTFTLA